MLPISARRFSIVAAALFALTNSWAALPAVSLKAVCLQQIQAPTSIANAADGSGRLFVCDQRGQIYIIQNGMMLPQPFLDLSSKIVPFAPTSYLFPMSASYDERGLLGLAFHPGYANAQSPGYRKFYVFYSAPSPNARGNPIPPATTPVPVNCRTTISEFQVSNNPNVGDFTTERVLLSFDKPQSNHNGGQLEFGPDGYLYFSTGDGGGANDINLGHNGATNPPTAGNLGNAQDKTRLLGKIHRIDPLGTNGPGGQYGIPATNPFVGAGGGVREEIYAYGLRNPWRFSFDIGAGGTGRLFEGDVGQNLVEEINIIVAGGNYGWHAREGAFTFDSAVQTALLTGGTVRIDGGTTTLPGGAVLTEPIAQYEHPNLGAQSKGLPPLGTSITGGFVYRGSAIPALIGKYVFGDYNFGAINSGTTQGALLAIEETSPNVWSVPASIPVIGANPIATTHLMAFGRDEQGELYIATQVMQGPRNDTATGLPTGGVYKIVAPQSVTKTLATNKDNTIFSEDSATPGQFTSDALSYLYAGKTGTNFGPYVRRALLAFDVAGQLPAGSVIQSVQLKLNLNRLGASATGTALSLYRLTQTWGEGTSDNGSLGYGAPATTNDATWARRFYDTMNPLSWTAAGGDFNAVASASRPAALGIITWDSATQPTVKTDVQGWLDTPASNAGWILRGDEVNLLTACRFDSKDIGATPPALLITYTSAPQPTHFESWLATYFPANKVGQYVDPSADFAGDGTPSLAKYAYGLSPLEAIPSDAGIQVTSAVSGENNICTYSFRRDAEATDLTYVLQSSTDLVNWNNIVQSAGGAVPSGTALVSESGLGGSIMSVTAQETLPFPAVRFVRLRISRAP